MDKKIYAEKEYEETVKKGKDLMDSLYLTEIQKQKYEDFLRTLLKLIAKTTAPGIEGYKNYVF